MIALDYQHKNNSGSSADGTLASSGFLEEVTVDGFYFQHRALLIFLDSHQTGPKFCIRSTPLRERFTRRQSKFKPRQNRQYAVSTTHGDTPWPKLACMLSLSTRERRTHSSEQIRTCYAQRNPYAGVTRPSPGSRRNCQIPCSHTIRAELPKFVT